MSSQDIWGYQIKTVLTILWINADIFLQRKLIWKKISSITLGHITTDQYVLQGFWWQSTIYQWGKHIVHDGTSSENVISCCKLIWNIHRFLKILTYEDNLGKDMGELQNICCVRVYLVKVRAEFKWCIGRILACQSCYIRTTIFSLGTRQPVTCIILDKYVIAQLISSRKTLT